MLLSLVVRHVGRVVAALARTMTSSPSSSYCAAILLCPAWNLPQALLTRVVEWLPTRLVACFLDN